jgi:hypothetical protein
MRGPDRFRANQMPATEGVGHNRPSRVPFGGASNGITSILRLQRQREGGFYRSHGKDGKMGTTALKCCSPGGLRRPTARLS